MQRDDLSIEGLVIAAAMALLATIGDQVNEHRFFSLWFTMFLCSLAVLYVSLGCPHPWKRRQDP